MKIAVLATPLDNQLAGIHHYTRGMIDSFAHQKSDHKYILIRSKKKNDFPSMRHVVIPELKWLPGFASFRMFFLIPVVVRILKVDWVIEPAHFGPFNLPKKVKRMTIIHDLTPILFPRYHTFTGSFLQKMFLPGILKRADLIIANSEHTKRDLENVYPHTIGKVKRITPGVDDLFNHTIDTSVLIKHQIQRPYFLFVGTIEPRKNLITLLEAYRIYREVNTESCQLVIVGGKGWKSREFYQSLDMHKYRNDIILTGYVDREDLPALYSQCEWFIYPSIYEGFGFPVAEALSCGAKCLVAGNSSLKEFDLSGVYFFRSFEHESLATKMREVSGKPDSPNSKRFSWRDFGNQLLNVLNE